MSRRSGCRTWRRFARFARICPAWRWVDRGSGGMRYGVGGPLAPLFGADAPSTPAGPERSGEGIATNRDETGTTSRRCGNSSKSGTLTQRHPCSIVADGGRGATVGRQWTAHPLRPRRGTRNTRAAATAASLRSPSWRTSWRPPAGPASPQSGDGFTIVYLEGPKAGLEIHFFGETELRGLFATGFEPVLPVRAQVTWRPSPQAGQWTQWEAIWRASGPRSA